jgi:N-acyl amino acid synthase FeeM
MPIEIRHITKPAELIAVYRQRYTVYVEELKYPQRYADHAARTVVEPLDSYGHILGAYEEGVLVGSIRINFGSEAAFGNYVDLYHMRSFASYFPERLSICTKFIVARSHRASMIMNELSKASFTYAPVHRAGNVFNLIDSKPPLDGYFRRLGYRQVQPNIMHPDAGEVVPLVLVIFDKSYLERIGSPFARLLQGMRDDESMRWFYKAFAGELVKYDSQESCPYRTRKVFRDRGQMILPVSPNTA